jgi:hypothetical protein
MLHLKLLKYTTRRKREIIKTRDEIETKIIRQKIKETKGWFFEKINKINKPLANLIKMRRGK